MNRFRLKHFPALFLTAGLVALGGCSSTPTHVDSGPVRARTFSFVEPAPKAQPVFNDPWKPVHTLIQDSITRNLATKGVTRTARGGDVIVAYLIITGDNASTGSINEYFGTGRDAFSVQEKAQDAYAGSKNPNYFRAGTLVIDVLEATNYKLLKRGYATRPLLQQPTADAQASRMQEVVDEILRDLRVAAK